MEHHMYDKNICTRKTSFTGGCPDPSGNTSSRRPLGDGLAPLGKSALFLMLTAGIAAAKVIVVEPRTRQAGFFRSLVFLLSVVMLSLPTWSATADDSNFRIWGSPSFSGSIQSDDVVVEVAAGRSHTVAVLEDGSIRCWGRNNYGECDVPSGVGNNENPVMSIAAGGYMTIALLAPPACRGDLTGDDLVDGADLNELLGLWGACVTDACPADLDGNGQVDGADLLELLSAWGPCA